MQPATPTGETQVVTDPKTTANPTVTQPSQTVDPAIEELRKKAEQAEMRANQLANQLEAKTKAEADAEAKKLEESNQFNTLYEQEKAKREAAEAAQAEALKQATLKAKAEEVFAEFPAEVKTLAQETGLTLVDVEEDAVAAFKAKLEKVGSLIKQPKVTANNPGNATTPTAQQPANPEEMKAMLNDPKRFEEYLRKNTSGIASMMNKRSE